ncbi:MAG TPA: carbohydrate ABC transporter permease [Jiangellales bacterium]|nr:carbohydrate ABC transporter permease [Jiangellales bacterium]
MPTYLLVVNALTPADEYGGRPGWFPTGLGYLDNLTAAWNAAGLGLGVYNSLLYASLSAGTAVVVAAMASFAVIVMPVRRRGLWFWLIYSGTLLPLQVFLAPLFKAYVGVELYDTQLGMVIIYAALCVPFAFFMVRNYLTTVAVEISEAAQMDGAGWWRLFWQIHLPLARSALLAAFVFQFTWVWNDLLFGITLSTSPNIRPVMAALAELDGGYSSLGPPIVLAAALAVSLPTVLLFLAVQRFFVSSLKPVG